MIEKGGRENGIVGRGGVREESIKKARITERVRMKGDTESWD